MVPGVNVGVSCQILNQVWPVAAESEFAAGLAADMYAEKYYRAASV